MNPKLKLTLLFVLVAIAPLYIHASPQVSDHFEIARAAYAIHDYQNCLKYAQMAEEEFRDSASPAFHVGLCAERVGKFELAYDAFRRSRSKDPSDPDVYNNLVILSIKTLSVQRAEADLQTFQSKFPLDKRISELRAMINGIKELRAQSGMSDDEMRAVILESYLNKKRSEAKP